MAFLFGFGRMDRAIDPQTPSRNPSQSPSPSKRQEVRGKIHPHPHRRVRAHHRPAVSESRIKRITQITRITPHIPTAALSFPSAVSFTSAAIDLSPRPPLFASLIVGYACAYKERGSTWLFWFVSLAILTASSEWIRPWKPNPPRAIPSQTLSPFPLPRRYRRSLQRSVASNEARGETGKRPLRIRTQMKGKTHTAGQGGAGHARVDRWMSGARTWAERRAKDIAERNDEAAVGRWGGLTSPLLLLPSYLGIGLAVGRRGTHTAGWGRDGHARVAGGKVRPHGRRGRAEGHARAVEWRGWPYPWTSNTR